MPPDGAGPSRRRPISEDEEAAEARKREVLARVQSLDAAQTRDYLETLCTRWQLHIPNRAYEHVVSLAFENFGVSVSDQMDLTSLGNFGIKDLDNVIHTHEMEAIALYHHMRHVGLLTAQDDDIEHGTEDAATLLNKILKGMEMVYYAKRIVLSAFQAKLAIHQIHCADLSLEADIDARLGSWSLRFRWIDTEMTQTQHLLLYLLDCAFERQLRKQDGYVFEPIIVEKKHNSHAFRRIYEIKEWVYAVTQKELQWKQWTNLTSGGNTIKNVVDYLSCCNDHQFPFLKKRRDVFSFRNGVYNARDDVFYEYESATEPLADSIVAAKYFDTEFCPYTEVHDWRLIPTPHLQSILDFQDLPAAVCDWLYILLGRLLYDINDFDGWQILIFLKGAAGTGKSSIITRVAKNFYDTVDVGVLSNNMEKKFGLSAFWDKYMYVGPEIKEDLAIEQSEFQSIVSGEDVQVAVKHKKAFSTIWRPPGILAGNSVPSWADNSGSIQRRIVLFDFVKPVGAHGDMRLGDKLEVELPDILVKCNRAYRQAAAAHGSTQIWTLLPPYFKNTSSELAQTINALEAFMESTEVVYAEDALVPFDDFKNSLTAFAQVNGYPRPRFSIDYFRGPFGKRTVRKDKGTFTWRGRVLTREFLFGVDLAQSDETVNVL